MAPHERSVAAIKFSESRSPVRASNKLGRHGNMGERRQFLAVLASACGLTPLILWLAKPSPVETMAETFPVQKSDDDWRHELTPDQYQVLRHHSTERPFTSPLNHEKR